MKKIITVLTITLPILFGCSKSLDTSPYSSITDASAFSTSARCALVMNGVYDAAQGSYYVGGTTENRGYPFGAANIEQQDARGEDVVSAAAFFQITYQATHNSVSPNIVGMWKGLYELINKCNIAISGFRAAAASGVLTTAVANQYEGECRFLRALSHHEALLFYARPYLDGAGSKLGVPWRDEPMTSSSAVGTIYNKPRMAVAGVYANMLTDLDYAEANLVPLVSPLNTIPGYAEPGVNTFRVTKAAAIALKMRLKLHMGDWGGVITEGAKIVPVAVTPTNAPGTVSPIGNWALTASPDGPFVNNASSESMFSIKNQAIDAPSTNGGLSRMFGSATATGRGLISISPVIWNNGGWLCDDKRRSSILTVTGVNANGGAANTCYFTTKYRDYTTWADWAPQIRYAEVILTLAEAEARNAGGVSSRAVDLLNLVRNRSLTDPATQAYTVGGFPTKVELIRAILLERRIEFLCEGKRWSDISRLATDATYTTGGIPAKAINGTAGLAVYVCGAGYATGQVAVPYSEFNFIWPIPASEVTSNPIVVQNPFY